MEDPLHTLPLGAAFKIAFVGFAVGILTLMAIPLGIGIIASFMEGNVSQALLGIVILPLIAVIQGLVVGGLVFIGLAVFRKVRKKRH